MEQQGKLASRATEMLRFTGELARTNTPHQRTSLERQIASVEAQIDALVYQLYGLTDAEIAIVEAATRE